jgi:hypothetical protein
MDENAYENVISTSKKSRANRRNAQLSTGPKTEEGKSRSRRNALRHGILASALLLTRGAGAEDSAEFEELLRDLRLDRAPVGALEEMFVEKIAVCWWRQKRALRCEAGLMRQQCAELEFSALIQTLEAEGDPEFRTPEPGDPDTTELLVDDLGLARGAEVDRLLRYETAIQRQLIFAINQLERLQRARAGDYVSAPVSVQVSSDQ